MKSCSEIMGIYRTGHRQAIINLTCRTVIIKGCRRAFPCVNTIPLPSDSEWNHRILQGVKSNKAPSPGCCTERQSLVRESPSSCPALATPAKQSCWIASRPNATKVGALVALATPSAGLGSVEDLLRMTMAWIGSGNGNVNLSTPLHCALREFELAIDLIPKFPSPVLRILIQCRFYAG